MKSHKRKIPLWIPYSSSLSFKGKTTINIEYKGGTYTGDISQIHSILFYGSTCNIDQTFLDACLKYGIPICYHRRNVKRALWITPSTKASSRVDIITKQILTRYNLRKRKHITRKLLQAKFKSMEWLVPYPIAIDFKNISINEMISIEAQHAQRYWRIFYDKIGFKNNSRRGNANTPKACLDAISKLISGVILRYITYHGLSPFHAFIHTPTSYPSLTYDLIEPYRGFIDKVVFDTLQSAMTLEEQPSSQETIAWCVRNVEDFLDNDIYVSATRQIASFQELLHGIVLALISYFDGSSQRFIVPFPGKPNGGRPVKTGYRLYGRSAGPTDFWDKAEKASQDLKKRLHTS